MITRIFRVQIRPELRDLFERDFQTISISQVKSQQGFISVTIGKPTLWTPDEYLMISYWENVADLESFAGENWNQAVIPSGMEQYVLQCWVHHFESC